MTQASSHRLLRYYACAVAGEVRELGKTNSILKAIAYGEKIAAGELSWSEYDVRRLCDQLKKLSSNQDNFQKRTAREVAILCIEYEIVRSQFMTIINAVRQFKGKNFDDDIHDCIRPEYIRKSTGIKRDYICAMAHKMYDEEDYVVGAVLADACEEVDLLNQEAWDHLRKDCHWRGCWVLDDILGIWG